MSRPVPEEIARNAIGGVFSGSAALAAWVAFSPAPWAALIACGCGVAAFVTGWLLGGLPYYIARKGRA